MINYYFVILVLVLFTLIFVIFGPVFKIKNINIIKKDDITNINIAYKSIESLRGINIFSLKKPYTLEKLQNYQKNIKDINIDFDFPNSIKILVESYKGVFNTSINGKEYIITENGTLVPGRPREEYKNIFISMDLNKEGFLDYKNVFKHKYMYQIRDAIQKIEENIINIEIKNIHYYVTEREIHLELKNDTLLIINIDIDINNQITKAAVFNKEHINISKNTLVYIDLRVKNKVFYCEKETEFTCKQNLKKIYK